jgi:hypothetical protein
MSGLVPGIHVFLFAVVVGYFYFGWKVLGGTIWQRIFGRGRWTRTRFPRLDDN